MEEIYTTDPSFSAHTIPGEPEEGSGRGREVPRSRKRGSRRKEAAGREAAGLRESGSSDRRKDRPGRRRGFPLAALFLSLVLGVMSGLGVGYWCWGWERPYTVDLKAVEVPEWVDQDFIRKNIFSRPDVGRSRVNSIVIHYVANAGSTAKGNRDYFDSLADQDPQQSGTSASSHFIVGLEGEVIQCIPVNEIAYANAPRNDDTIAIEVCHPDDTGRFNDASYEAAVNLTAWLCRELKLDSGDLLRHYDINGKDCPKYYVTNEEAWSQFKSDVDQALKAL